MFEALNKPDQRSLFFNLLIAVGSALIINGLIFGLGWDRMNTSSNTPSGYLVGGVWVILFMLMAVTRWRLNACHLTQRISARTWVTILMASCLLYPFYSLAIHSQIGGFLGNLFTIALTAFVIVQVWQISKFTALLILPIIPWVTFATVTILKDLNWL